jgi:DNA-binding transcriptional MerR regulator/methylmalonyl-CoA mutase cobalamin-binding subunit
MHPIKYVSKTTGLSPHVIRVWERRYKAVTPTRTETNRRLYSDTDIERLTLLRQATQAGHNISQLTKLPIERLREIGSRAGAPVLRPNVDDVPKTPAGEIPLAECLAAVEKLDDRTLDRLLNQAAVHHSQTVVIENLIVPMLEQIGDRWSTGELRPAHEHLATAVVRSFVANIVGAYHPDASAPRLIVTTPAGQWHELGALLVTATAAAQGWRVTYLGPNLPADEIAGAAAQNSAQAVALSVVYPGDDPNVALELRKLRAQLPAEVHLLVGGRCASRYEKVLKEIHAIHITDMAHLRRELVALRG